MGEKHKMQNQLLRLNFGGVKNIPADFFKKLKASLLIKVLTLNTKKKYLVVDVFVYFAFKYMFSAFFLVLQNK